VSAVSPAVGEPVVEGVGKLSKLLPQLVVLLLPHFLLKYDKTNYNKAAKNAKKNYEDADVVPYSRCTLCNC
jgi:hypothetical protein